MVILILIFTVGQAFAVIAMLIAGICLPFALIYDLFGEKTPSEPEIRGKELLELEERHFAEEIRRADYAHDGRVDAAAEREGRRLAKEKEAIEQGKREEEQARAEAIEQEKRMLESFDDDGERL